MNELVVATDAPIAIGIDEREEAIAPVSATLDAIERSAQGYDSGGVERRYFCVGERVAYT